MKRFFTIFLAFAATASAQTYITVTADTNRVIRTNFSLVRSQVSDLSGATFAISNITSLQSSLDSKLETNGSAATLTNFPASLLTTNGSAGALTNFPASLLTTNGSAAALTNFPASLLVTNGSAAALTNFPAFLLQTNGDAAGLTNFPTFNQNTTGTASNVTGVIAISNGGTGTNTAAAARSNLLPSYAGNSNKVLAVTTDETDVEWIVGGGGGGGDSVTNSVGAVAIPTNSTTTGTNYTTSITIGINATNLGDCIVIGPGAEAAYSFFNECIAIGRNARINADNQVAIGYGAYTYQGNGSVAIGVNAVVTNTGGKKAVQLGEGSANDGSFDVVQFFNWGTVNSTEWGALATSTSPGQAMMKITNAGSSNRFLISAQSAGDTAKWTAFAGITTNISVVGTNNTNTLVFSNGILTSVTSP